MKNPFTKNSDIIRHTILKKSEDEVAYKNKITRIISSQSESKREIQMNVDRVVPLLNIKYDVEVERLENLQRTMKLEEVQKKNKESNLQRKKILSDEDLRLNRIIPYVKFSDNCADKIKKFRYSTKSQKSLYQFNKMITEGEDTNPETSKIQRIASSSAFKKR
jgi:hypothetical protein